MCHEATSVGLPDSIDSDKGTVMLEDFDHADVISCIGHNPGTNYARVLTTLREAAKCGCAIGVFNRLRERRLERFAAPQNPFEMATLGWTPTTDATKINDINDESNFLGRRTQQTADTLKFQPLLAQTHRCLGNVEVACNFSRGAAAVILHF